MKFKVGKKYEVQRKRKSILFGLYFPFLEILESIDIRKRILNFSKGCFIYFEEVKDYKIKLYKEVKEIELK